MNDSENARTYKIVPTNMAYTGQPALEIWETRAAASGAAFNSNYLKYVCDLAADTGGAYTVTVKPYSVVTVSTLVNVGKVDYNTPLPIEGTRAILDTDAAGSTPSTSDTILYADDFDYSSKTVPVIGANGQITGTDSYVNSRGGALGVIPRYTCDRNGGFEAYLPSGSTNYVLRQQVDQAAAGLGGTWNSRGSDHRHRRQPLAQLQSQRRRLVREQQHSERRTTTPRSESASKAARAHTP